MKNHPLSALLVALTLAAPLALHAEEAPPCFQALPPGPHGTLPEMAGMAPPPQFLRGIELSEAQQDRIFALQHAAAPELRQRLQSLHAAAKALQNLRCAEGSDADALRQAGTRLGTALGELAATQAQSERQILAVLTSEQRAQALKNAQQRPFPPHRQFPPPPEKFADAPPGTTPQRRQPPSNK